MKRLALTQSLTKRTRTSIITGAIACLLLAVVVVALSQAAAEGSPLAAQTQSEFPDVPSSHPYYVAISTLAEFEIVGGYINGNFGPDDLVMRQQFAKMIVLALDLEVKEDDFPTPAVPFVDLGADVSSSLYSHEYVAVCARNNITKGTDATHFAPLDNITRAQLISMVVRAADGLAPGTLDQAPAGWTGQLAYGDPTHGANILKAEYNGLLVGIRGSGSTLAGWNTAGAATRGEVAQILFNLRGELSGSPTTTTSTSTTTTTLKPTTTTTQFTTTTTTTATTPSSGPALVVASLPSVIPCTKWGDNGCQWDYTVTFTEKNGVPATIDRMGRRYIQTDGDVWVSGSGEWFDKTIAMNANGSNTYSSWVRTTNGCDSDLRGGTLVVSYSGYDENGYTFSGSVSAKFAYAP